MKVVRNIVCLLLAIVICFGCSNKPGVEILPLSPYVKEHPEAIGAKVHVHFLVKNYTTNKDAPILKAYAEEYARLN